MFKQEMGEYACTNHDNLIVSESDLKLLDMSEALLEEFYQNVEKAGSINSLNNALVAAERQSKIIPLMITVSLLHG